MTERDKHTESCEAWTTFVSWCKICILYLYLISEAGNPEPLKWLASVWILFHKQRN